MKNNDEYNTLLWVISGMISTVIFADGYSSILKFLHFELFYSWNFAADLIIQGQQNIESFYGVCIGLAADYFIGSTNGFLIGLVLKWLGTSHFWLKGMGVALSNWMALGFLTQIFPQLFTYNVTQLTYFTYFFSYCLFGMVTAYLIVKFSK